MSIRVLVCGGRTFDDEDFMDLVLTSLHLHFEFSVLIHGGGRRWDKVKQKYVGADYQAGEWARWHGVPVESFPAKWKTYKWTAGLIRNEHMLRHGRPELVIGFPGAGGTSHMLDLARSAGVQVVTVGK